VNTWAADVQEGGADVANGSPERVRVRLVPSPSAPIGSESAEFQITTLTAIDDDDDDNDDDDDDVGRIPMFDVIADSNPTTGCKVS
jgi:hypothetical protein